MMASQITDWKLLKSSCVPGEFIYSQMFLVPQAYKIAKYNHYWNDYGIEVMELVVDYYDWDGHRCGFRKAKLETKAFRGEIPFSDLEFIPFKFLNNQMEVKGQLIRRGKKFEAMLGYHFKHYSGMTATSEHMKNGRRISARVIVDAYAYHKFFSKRWLDDGQESSKHSEDISEQGPSEADEQEYSITRIEFIKPFTEEHYLLSPPVVKGFHMEDREWCQLYLDCFSEIVFNESAYDKLVLDEGEKKILLAFGEQVRDSQMQFDDLIKNKGRGLMILLFGPPGVGKTLTAEAVAERAHLPLYAVNAGDIGHKADEANNTLNTVFECCRLWKYLLLVDEAEVFLEARGTDSLIRNELVSVFLRRLERFRGLMFLTTNRPRSIDPAFESRLDLIIPYKKPRCSRSKSCLDYIHQSQFCTLDHRKRFRLIVSVCVQWPGDQEHCQDCENVCENEGNWRVYGTCVNCSEATDPGYESAWHKTVPVECRRLGKASEHPNLFHIFKSSRIQRPCSRKILHYVGTFLVLSICALLLHSKAAFCDS